MELCLWHMSCSISATSALIKPREDAGVSNVGSKPNHNMLLIFFMHLTLFSAMLS
mgnify:CR=1 FL=1